jgi:ABC-type lipoprotein release transport system permease subunit
MIDSFNKQKLYSSPYHQLGLTLLELTIVLLIIMAMAGLILPSFNEVPAYAQCTATKSTMKAIRDALLGNVAGAGYVEDMGFFPVQFEPVFYILGVSFGTIITLLAGYIPAKKAANVDPVSILRR